MVSTKELQREGEGRKRGGKGGEGGIACGGGGIRQLLHLCKVDAAVAITAAPAPGATASAATATAAGCTVHARKFMLPRALHDLTFNVHVTRTRVMYAKAASDKKACVCFAELTDDDEDDDEDNDDDDVDGDEEDEKGKSNTTGTDNRRLVFPTRRKKHDKLGMRVIAKAPNAPAPIAYFNVTVSRGHRAVDVEDDNEDDVGDAGADGTFRVLKIQKLQGLY
ncbi:hypothetical protein HZH68_003008 [Vespula germanica]|uniref:Uncharacterized protein n=1 Tax=Vespula germanica TaxID=30212 RepID=A0A834NNG1_VESGE|nr:hypothetical protein HZH68_003008 [Vespula germanica]